MPWDWILLPRKTSIPRAATIRYVQQHFADKRYFDGNPELEEEFVQSVSISDDADVVVWLLYHVPIRSYEGCDRIPGAAYFATHPI